MIDRLKKLQGSHPYPPSRVRTTLVVTSRHVFLWHSSSNRFAYAPGSKVQVGFFKTLEKLNSFSYRKDVPCLISRGSRGGES